MEIFDGVTDRLVEDEVGQPRVQQVGLLQPCSGERAAESALLVLESLADGLGVVGAHHRDRREPSFSMEPLDLLGAEHLPHGGDATSAGASRLASGAVR